MRGAPTSDDATLGFRAVEWRAKSGMAGGAVVAAAAPHRQLEQATPGMHLGMELSMMASARRMQQAWACMLQTAAADVGCQSPWLHLSTLWLFAVIS